MTGYNSVVIINCGDNERAIYGFLDDVSVKEGDRVSRKPIGRHRITGDLPWPGTVLF